MPRGRFIAEGAWLVQRLLQSRLTTESVVVERRKRDEILPWVRRGTVVIELPDGSASELVGFDFHRGVLACGVRPPRRTVAEMIDDLPASRNRPALIVCVAGVRDAENLGGVLRNAAAFAANGVLLGCGTADPYSRRVLRVSMGAVFHTPLAWSDDLVADLRQLQRRAHLTTLATVLDASATPLDDFKAPLRSLLLLGEEGYGLSAELRQACLQQLTIPMAPGVDSLNVATASGIFLHHLARVGRE